MASLHMAQQVSQFLFAQGARHFGMRPRATGVVALGGGAFAVKVTLPRPPTTAQRLPRRFRGVVLDYDFQLTPAEAV